MARLFTPLFSGLCSVLLTVASTAQLSVAATPEDRTEELHREAQQAEAAGDLQSAANKYVELIRLSPRIAPAYNNLGALYFQMHLYPDAIETLQRGLKIDPGMAPAYALLGMSYYQMNDYRKAQAPLEKAVKLTPGDARAELTLVNTLTKLNDFNGAATRLQHLLTEQPKNQQFWYLLGRVYIQLSQDALGKVNEIDPDSVWSHEIGAELDESMKNFDGAIVQWKKAEEKAPTQPGVHFKLGDLYWSLAQWDNATHEFDAEKRIDPGNCRIDWKLGDILLQKNEQLDLALADVESALKTCPQLTEAHADRGRLLLKAHRDKEAVSELSIAAQTSPAEPGNHFLLAQAYRALGQQEQARSEMKLFSELEQKARAATAEQAEEVIKNKQNTH